MRRMARTDRKHMTYPVLRWLYMASGPGKKWILALSLLQVAQGLEGTLFAFALRGAVDCAVAQDGRGFLVHTAVLCGLALLAVVIHVSGWYGVQKSMALMEERLRVRVFTELLRRSYPEVSGVHSGEWMTRITSDVDTIVGTLLNVLPKLLGIAVQIVSAWCALYLLLPQAAYILLPASAVMMIVSASMRKKLKASFKAVTKADGEARSFMQERLAGMDVIRTFAQEPQVAAQAGRYHGLLTALRLRRCKFAAVCDFGAYSAMRLGYLVGVILCGAQIASGAMSYGTMTAVLQLVNRIDGPISQLSDFVMKWFAMSASAERLMEIETLPLDPHQPVRPEEVQDYYTHRFQAAGLRSACFAYDGSEGHLVIKDLDLEIRKGEYVALTGESGSGKSTALKLLIGLYPLGRGEVYLRDSDGCEHRQDGTWRTLFAYVPQGDHLLSGTIREAVAFGDPGRMGCDEDIWQALKVACADRFTAQLDAGLDTVLGEHGAGLSAGQLQRLAIARAVFSGRPVLILDESTSALDEATERRLLMNLRTMTDKTVIMVTHRPAALSICDRQIAF